MDTIFKGLPFKFDCKPDFGYLTINVPQGEMVKVEAAAMAGMDTNMEMKTKTNLIETIQNVEGRFCHFPAHIEDFSKQKEDLTNKILNTGKV